MILKENYYLSNGIEIPKLRLGTWRIKNDNVVQAVVDAVKTGYRHIDTAQAYANESGVGDGIRACGQNKEDLFITSKLAAEIKSYEKAVSSIDQTLKTIRLDYIDMMIIHGPQPWRDFGNKDRYFEGNRAAWRALEEAYKAGKIRAIGVSKFQKEDHNNILSDCTVKPMVNQILDHISNTPTELIQYTQEHGILVEAYSPIAHGELLKNKKVLETAEKYGVSVKYTIIIVDYLVQYVSIFLFFSHIIKVNNTNSI
ncbi:aldo/keto reductase [Niallia taxi]|uniref:aldo/keto reductase n=1 Tax=Niallia taxi TaxID=2499688 RepID=UPI002E1B9388|nr:aldo/keto reductase [Niallia taxi]